MARRESTPLLDKVKIDPNLIKKARAAIASEKVAESKKKSSERNEVEELAVLKYLNTQVCQTHYEGIYK